MHVIIATLFILAAWRWGDWKNWKTYYPTILFMIIGDLLYNFMLYNFPMWEYEGMWIEYHTIINLISAFVMYPCTVLLFFSYQPKRVLHFVLYILFWVFIYAVIEIVFIQMDHIVYSNGWGLPWSLLFCIIMFLILWVHHHKPLIAWALSFSIIVILFFIFDVPIERFK